MAETKHPTPHTTFNFDVQLTLEGSSSLLCHAAFAECDGLEMNMQPKTYQEGGNNAQQIHLSGPVTYGQLSLKRGMTDCLDLWDWFDEVTGVDGYSKRAECVVSVKSADGERNQVRYKLTRCLPVRLRAPALNAKDGQVAIEEMSIVYERLQLIRDSG
jgi:phage tail-like protein